MTTEKDTNYEGSFEHKLDAQLYKIREMLLAKNKAYGNSALEPVRVMSKASPKEQLLVRMDDKLSRMMSGQADNEDPMMDLVGYYFLLKIAEEEEQPELTFPRAYYANGKVNVQMASDEEVNEFFRDIKQS